MLYFPMKITLAIIFMIASSCLACELTPEAREARSYVSEQLRYPYNECIGSVNSFHYWQSVAKCEAEGKGANVGGGCQHIASRMVPETEPDFSHCEIFKVSAEEFVKVLEHYMEEENITRCSTSQPPAAGQSKAAPLPAG